MFTVLKNFLKRHDTFAIIASQLYSSRTKNVANAVLNQISGSFCSKRKSLSQEINSAPRTIPHVFRDKIDLWAYKRRTKYLLNTRLRCLGLKRSKKLLRVCGKNLFKISCSRMRKCLPMNRNSISRMTKCMLGQAKIARVQRGYHPSSVEVWCVVEWGYCDSFLHNRIKMTAKICEETSSSLK